MVGAPISLSGVSLAGGSRTLFSGLDLEVARGEFLAVLGPNGAGKSTFLRLLLGLVEPVRGDVSVLGGPPRRARDRIGFVPQQRSFDPDLPVRCRDLVELGLSGHRFGFPFPTRASRHRVDAILDAVGVGHLGPVPIGHCSGGEQQRVRIAQALVAGPEVLLCDEPLLSLDLAHQQSVVALIDAHRRASGCAVVFVTHEINPILDYVDRVLYFVDGKFAVGSKEEVFTPQVLSELYATPVEVFSSGERLVIVGADDDEAAEPVGHHHHHIAPNVAPGER